MRKRLKWLVPLLLVVLIGSLLPVRWVSKASKEVASSRTTQFPSRRSFAERL